jgi:ubiquinone/menaquinone biosynthesis C-methylase UbiE
MFEAKWTAVDISSSAVRATQAAFPGIEVLFADIERLPFADDEFDVAFVAATLHHLPRPMVGLYELLRVSQDVTILVEPNDSWLTRLATTLGAAHEYEEAGNYVYRLSASDVKRVAKAASCRLQVDRFFATHRVARSPSEYLALRALNQTVNTVMPRLGNYIIAVLEK